MRAQGFFRTDEQKHCIRKGGSKDWDGKGDRFAWKIASVKRLAKPLAVSTGHTGWAQPRSYTVSFPEQAGEFVTQQVIGEEHDEQAAE